MAPAVARWWSRESSACHCHGHCRLHPLPPAITSAVAGNSIATTEILADEVTREAINLKK
jgi:hypothetical protein